MRQLCSLPTVVSSNERVVIKNAELLVLYNVPYMFQRATRASYVFTLGIAVRTVRYHWWQTIQTYRRLKLAKPYNLARYIVLCDGPGDARWELFPPLPPPPPHHWPSFIYSLLSTIVQLLAD